MYLQGADCTTPFDETFEAVDKEYRRGRFEEIRLSNFKAQKVDDCIAMCKKNGWVLPTVYQDHYDALMRGGKTILFLC